MGYATRKIAEYLLDARRKIADVIVLIVRTVGNVNVQAGSRHNTEHRKQYYVMKSLTRGSVNWIARQVVSLLARVQIPSTRFIYLGEPLRDGLSFKNVGSIPAIRLSDEVQLAGTLYTLCTLLLESSHVHQIVRQFHE